MCLTQDLSSNEGGRRPEETLAHLLAHRRQKGTVSRGGIRSSQMPPKSSCGTGLVSIVLLLGGEGAEP